MILRGQITAEQQTILDEIDQILIDAEESMWRNNEYFLQVPVLRALVAANCVTVDQVLAMPFRIYSLFEEYPVMMQAILMSKKMTWEQMTGISERRTQLLNEQFIVQAISENVFRVDQILLFPDGVINNLSNQSVREGVTRGSWTLNQAINFTPQELSFINQYGVPREIYGTAEWDAFRRLQILHCGYFRLR